jgi:hypothetical protein
MRSDRRSTPFLLAILEESEQDLHSVLDDLVLDGWLHVLLIENFLHSHEAFLSEVLVNLLFLVLVYLSLT